MKAVLLALIGFYGYAISPMLGRHCRFEPSCSEYAADAIKEHGIAHGAWLSTHRLCRCHPWQPGGFDPVPRQRS